MKYKKYIVYIRANNYKINFKSNLLFLKNWNFLKLNYINFNFYNFENNFLLIKIFLFSYHPPLLKNSRLPQFKFGQFVDL